jgi:hypothetical protein
MKQPNAQEQLHALEKVDNYKRHRKRNKSSEAGNFLISSSGRNEMEEDRHYGL